MTQIFFPSESNKQKLYSYINHSSKIVVVRLLGLADRHCERVVFPGEKFLFEASENCKLEINKHSINSITGIIKDIIPCTQLQIAKS